MQSPQLTQKLIDHELTPEQRKQFIESIDGDDEFTWKSIALGFVEKQILDEWLGHEFAQANMEKTAMSKAALPLEECDSNYVTTSSMPSGYEKTSRRKTANSQVSQPGGWGIALAVGFLLLGYFLGGFFQPSGNSSNSSLPDHSAFAKRDSESGNDRTANSKEGVPTSLKLTDALARCSTPIPDQFRRDLLSAGYVLNEDQEIQTVSLPFGGTVEMPVRKFDIHYLGSSVYQ